MDNKRKCKATRNNSGLPCSCRALEGSVFCINHDPATHERIRKEAYELFMNKSIEYEAGLLAKQTELGKVVEALKLEHGQLWDQVHKLRFERDNLTAFIEQVGSIARLEEIYQVAKETKDAKTMEAVNKSMYYAKKTLNKNMIPLGKSKQWE